MATVNMPGKITGDNSNKSREKAAAERPKGSGMPLEKGKAKIRSKPLAMKFAEVFFEGSLKDAVNYMINDIAIPQIKNAVLKGIEVIFYGGVNGSSSGRGSSGPTPYNSFYIARDGTRKPAGSSTSSGRNQADKNEPGRSGLKKLFDPKLIVVEDRGEAQRVLLDLKADCDNFGQVGVDRLFELVNITSDWTSTKYGWVKGDLDNAKVRPCGDGYWFDLPDPIMID